MQNQTIKPDYGPAGWGALIAAVVIGWRVWAWQWPGITAQANGTGSGLLVGIAIAAWWTLLAAVGGAIATYGVGKVLGAVGRAFGRGWRQGA